MFKFPAAQASRTSTCFWAGMALSHSVNSALEMANRLCEKCRNLEFDIPISLSISIGLTEVHNDDTDFVDCMRRADKLLFRAKNNGRDRIEFG